MRLRNLIFSLLMAALTLSGMRAEGQTPPPALLAATDCNAVGAAAQGGICAGTEKNAIIVTLQSSLTLFTWEGSIAYCRGLTAAGYNDWELPTRKELLSLYPVRKKLGGFSGTPYWSATAFNSHTGWMVDFSSGTSFIFPKETRRPVRCVRRAGF
jgi:hypothetical protein